MKNIWEIIIDVTICNDRYIITVITDEIVSNKKVRMSLQ